jgi:hypothetical protein
MIITHPLTSYANQIIKQNADTKYAVLLIVGSSIIISILIITIVLNWSRFAERRITTNALFVGIIIELLLGFIDFPQHFDLSLMCPLIAIYATLLVISLIRIKSRKYERNMKGAEK